MLWHELRWPQISEINKNRPVMIPLAACEQHGRHLPLFVDTIQVTAIAERTEQELGDEALLLPTLWLGSSHHHLDFPGTVSVNPSLYSEVIKSMTVCILNSGFRRLLFLNGHGGNHVPVSQALSQLICEHEPADDAYLVLSTWWETNKDVIKRGMTTPAVTHACEYETSVMLALRPDLVALDQAREAPMDLDTDWVKTENEHASRVRIFRRFRRLTAAGSMGRPSAASAEKGNRILDAAVPEMVRLVKDMARWPELPVKGQD